MLQVLVIWVNHTQWIIMYTMLTLNACHSSFTNSINEMALAVATIPTINTTSNLFMLTAPASRKRKRQKKRKIDFSRYTILFRITVQNFNFFSHGIDKCIVVRNDRHTKNVFLFQKRKTIYKKKTMKKERKRFFFFKNCCYCRVDNTA